MNYFLISHFVLMIGLMLCGGNARAEPRHGHHGSDHDHARLALERGEVRPMAEILALVAQAVPGEVIAVDFERDDAADAANWHYELKILTKDGHLREVEVDAATGRIVHVEDD